MLTLIKLVKAYNYMHLRIYIYRKKTAKWIFPEESCGKIENSRYIAIHLPSLRVCKKRDALVGQRGLNSRQGQDRLEKVVAI
jgi:hypothetical protein